MINPSKETIRKEARARRRGLENREQLGRAIQRELIDSEAFREAERLLLYVNMPEEVPTGDAIQAALEQGKELFVPYCVGDDLHLFRLLDRDAELEPGTFGILEPKADLRTIAERHGRPEQMDLIVVPGVAFDRSGNRLGQGRGYYDRMLAPVATRPRGQRPELIGLAFECQLFDPLPCDSHDIKMDRVIINV
jgi:5-formyltetrahydrofolate cyclo-ligase